MTKIALFGGIYSNYLALQVALRDVRRRGVDATYCLGDLGAFGPHPDRVFPLLDQFGVVCIQGNYDDSVGNALDDCQCGYTDPRDNYFAQISYDYTLENTSPENRKYLCELPQETRIELGDQGLLLCHGSPRATNEFLWQSTCSDHFLNRICETYEADWIFTTHTGLKWRRNLSEGRGFVNVGVLGRSENDGQTNVWYTIVEYEQRAGLSIEFVPVEYDYRRLASEMADEGLPEEFQETVMTGWWTTCLEILPSKERKRGKY